MEEGGGGSWRLGSMGTSVETARWSGNSLIPRGSVGNSPPHITSPAR